MSILAQSSNIGRVLSNSIARVVETIGSTLSETLFNAQGGLLLGLVVVLLGLRLIRGRRRHLTTAHWAKIGEKLQAVKRAVRQIRSTKINDVTLWCGSAPRWQTQGMMPTVTTLLTGSPPTVYIPDANQSIAVVGRPKSGKTFSAINPMLVSAIEQSMPIVLYDYKADDSGNGGQMAYIGTLAARYSYNVRIFAPGRDYSCLINPLDFIQNETDDATAMVLAEVFHSNIKQGYDRGDAFFGPAGQRLIQALFQFAKATPYPDLAMAFSVLQLPGLVERLNHAATEGQLSYFVRVAFSQLISTLESEKTSASIISTASDIVTRFISPRLLPAMIGDTNTPLLLDAKEMIIFQSDIFRQDAINPILAAVINLVMLQNFAIQRKVPIVFSADEFPTLYLPDAPTWANEHRSKGYVGIYGYQSNPQIVEAYGVEKTDILLSGLGTRFWFNPNNYKTAKEFEETLGNTEVWVRTASWSNNRSKEGRSRSMSEHLHQRPLISADELLHFDQGECILLNPGYRAGRRTSIPWHLKQITIPASDQAQERKCEKIWNEVLREKIIEREQKSRPDLNLEEQLRLRYEEAERLLPLPPQNKKKLPGGMTIPDF